MQQVGEPAGFHVVGPPAGPYQGDDAFVDFGVEVPVADEVHDVPRLAQQCVMNAVPGGVADPVQFNPALSHLLFECAGEVLLFHLHIQCR